MQTVKKPKAWEDAPETIPALECYISLTENCLKANESFRRKLEKRMEYCIAKIKEMEGVKNEMDM